MSDKGFCVTKYPEGVNRAKEELLGFLPDDPAAKEGFMKTALQWFIQW